MTELQTAIKEAEELIKKLDAMLLISRFNQGYLKASQTHLQILKNVQAEHKKEIEELNQEWVGRCNDQSDLAYDAGRHE